MGWWVSLVDEKGKLLMVEPFIAGGILKVSKKSLKRFKNGKIQREDLEYLPETEADISITYNYSRFFHFREELEGKKAIETTERLKEVVKEFGIKRDKDYWKSTKGNVGYICNILLSWAKKYPNGIWEID